MTSKAEKRRRKKTAAKLTPKAQRERATTGEAVKVEKPAKPIRRMDGLTWLATREPSRISAEQFLVGRRYGELCSEAARAELPGKAGLEGSVAFGSRTPSQSALDAVRAKITADGIILKSSLPPIFAEGLIELLVAVCHHGATLRSLADGDKGATLVLEERLKLGLSMLRPILNSRASLNVSLEAAE